jgi:hypothetical protein
MHFAVKKIGIRRAIRRAARLLPFAGNVSANGDGPVGREFNY